MIESYKGEVGRKVTHYFSALIPIIAYFIDKRTGILIMTILTGLLLSGELARMRFEFARNIFLKLFSGIIREDEEKENALTGASWLFIAALITLSLFPKPIAVCALLYLSVGDATAALVGKRYGRIKLGKKTLEGSLSFILSSVLITLWVTDLPLYVRVVGSLVAALMELLPGFIDDNLTIPLLSGAVMTLLITL